MAAEKNFENKVKNCMCTKEKDGKTYCRGCGNVQPKS